MKTVKVSGQSSEMKRLLAIAREEEVVLRTPDGDEFMLSAVDDFAYEVEMQRRNKQLMAFLDRRFKQARNEKGIPLEDVERRLGLPPYDAKKRASNKNGRKQK